MHNKKRGFTLIELLVVIAIIGILAGLLITGIASARQKAKNTRAIQDFNQIGLAAQIYYDQNNSTWPTFAQILSTGLYPTDNASWFCDNCVYSLVYVPSSTNPSCLRVRIVSGTKMIDKTVLCIKSTCPGTTCGAVTNTF